jgi:hypothetical protein
VTDNPRFIPGLDLSRRFYNEVLRDSIGTPHAAGRVGSGSDALGYDTPTSTDHDWGPRCHVFVEAADVDAVRRRIEAALPEEFLGWPVRFALDEEVPVQHHVEVQTIGRWLRGELAIDPRDGLSTRTWLLLPQQQLLHVTAGEVFHDDTGELAAVRARLAWYPDEVWRYLLGCAWRRIGQEEAFVGRTSEVGDEIGSRIVVARLARDLVRLCFLLERRYAPYSKWLGTAFARLDAAAELQPPLERMLSADTYEHRELGLVAAYETIGRRFNALGVVPLVEPTVRPFYSRPFLVLMADRFADACFATLEDPWLCSLPPVGSVDQYLDSTDALYAERAMRTMALLAPDQPPTPNP